MRNAEARIDKSEITDYDVVYRVHSYTRLRECVFISYGKREMDTWIVVPLHAAPPSSSGFPKHKPSVRPSVTSAVFQITSCRCYSYFITLRIPNAQPDISGQEETNQHFEVGHGGTCSLYSRG